MKEKDYHKLIEEQNTEKKALMFEKFKDKHNLASSAREHKKYNKKAICIASISAAFVAIFLIVAIPLLINNNNKTKIRYFNVSDCVAIDLDFTVKDYASDKNILYINWYDRADEVETKLYVNKNDSDVIYDSDDVIYDSDDVIYIQETIVNGETGEIVSYYVVDEFINIDVLTFYEETCNRSTTISNVSINWYYRDKLSVAIFTYKGYKYCIQLQDPMDEEAILKIVEEMITQ